MCAESRCREGVASLARRLFFFSSRRRHTRFDCTGVQTCALPISAQAEEAWQAWVREHGDPARLLLDLMAEHHAIQIADTEDGLVARLTPLGLAAIREQLVESGVEIPLLPDAEHMTAAQLISMAAGASEEEFTA